MNNARPKDLDSWLSFLALRHTPDVILGLERILVVAEKLQLTQFSSPVITVAGTNGKGTTVAALQRLYSYAGYRVGSYFSPHLNHFTERLIINDKESEQSQWIEAFEFISDTVADLPLTFFEFITLAALSILKNNKLDLLILEIGLGGRLDAVNCVENDLAIITQIAFDHCDRLGTDLESIGREKAGIFRKNKIAICSEPHPPQSVIRAAEDLNCVLYRVGEDFQIRIHESFWSWESAQGHFKDLPIPAIPIPSVASALMASYLLADRLPVSDADRIEAATNTHLSGRFQIFQDRCPLIFDVAHNEAAAILLAQRLAKTEVSGKTYAIFSVLDDKDCSAIVKAMGSTIQEWHVIPLDTPRAKKTSEIVKEITALWHQPCYNHPDLSSMWGRLREKIKPEDRVIIFGSFYTVAAVQAVLNLHKE